MTAYRLFLIITLIVSAISIVSIGTMKYLSYKDIQESKSMNKKMKQLLVEEKIRKFNESLILSHTSGGWEYFNDGINCWKRLQGEEYQSNPGCKVELFFAGGLPDTDKSYADTNYQIKIKDSRGSYSAYSQGPGELEDINEYFTLRDQYSN